MKLACILLAAGSGRRFGGDKLRFPIDGASMAESACALHAGVDQYCARILVARPGDAYIASVAERFGFALAVNERASQGIGTSAAKGIAATLAMDDTIDGALFAVCDQPYLTESTVRALIRQFSSTPTRIVAPCHKGKRGNPVIFPRSLFPAFAALDGDVGGSAIIRAHCGLLTVVPIENEAELFDIDEKPRS